MGNLPETIAAVAAKAKRYRERSRQPDPRPLGETNTRATLIDPILEALGWDTRDADEVAREYRPKGADNPVDYALKLNGSVCLLIEAKGLGESIDDRRWVGQVLGYATVAGVEWCVLTDGEQYRFYNAMARADADGKLFCQVHLVDDSPKKIARDLELLSRASLAKSHIEDRWASFFVDSRVEATLQDLLNAPHKAVIKLIQRHAPKPPLSPKEIASSLRRLNFHPRPSPAEPVAPEHPEARRARAASPTRAAGRKPSRGAPSPSLEDLIGAGLLKAPLRLFRRYKGHDLEAKLNADGSITFRGAHYRTCSTAAEVARGAITGRRMNTNGWTFWKYVGTDSKTYFLDSARRALQAKGR